MHYYQFNIGDYCSHTKGLSLLEDLAYRRLLDEYYLHEHPLNVDSTIVARQIGMREYQGEVTFVLNSFFEFTEQGWINPRADREIQHFHNKVAQASNAGKASAERRRNVSLTDVQLTNNQQPITNNQQPKKILVPKITAPEGVSKETWESFLEARKKNRAIVTPTVIKRIEQEAVKAGWTLENALIECVSRGWRGFKAEWVAEKQSKNVGERNRETMQGLTRGLIGSGKNVKLLGK